MKQRWQSFLSRWTFAEILLAIMFVFAPLYYHPNLGGAGLTIPNNSVIWIVAIIFMMHSISQMLKRKVGYKPDNFWMLTAFPSLVIMSGFISGVDQPLQWLFRVLFILAGFLYFWGLFMHDLKQPRREKVLFLVLVSGLIHGVVGVMQIWLKLDMPYLLPKSPNGLPSSFFQQINNHATLSVTAILIGFYLASRPLTLSRNKFLQTIIVSAVLISSFIVGASGSRVGLLALIVALPIMIVCRNVFLRKRFVFTGILLLSVLSGSLLGSFIGVGNAIDKTVTMQSGYSGSARLGIYSISMDLVVEKPFFGHGIGSFERVFQYSKPSFYEEYPDAKLPNSTVSHPHNEIILWSVESGLLSILGMLFVVIATITALRHLGLSRGGAYFALLVPITLHTQVELPFYMSVLHWLIFLTILWIIFSHSTRAFDIKLSRFGFKFAQYSTVSIGALMIFFMAHTIRANWDFVEFYKGNLTETPMPVAKQNPYLSDQAWWIDMSAILYTSMQYGQNDNVKYFAEWGEKRLQNHPDADLFEKLADAYQFLGDRHNYCQTVLQGYRIFPRSEKLKTAVGMCRL